MPTPPSAAAGPRWPGRTDTLRLVQRADLMALAVLVGLIAATAWNRMTFDAWLLRFDIYTQFLPWYHYLGEQVRSGNVPGWNPHILSGTPFAGHPLTGWMYLPVMVVFALLPVLTGFKALVAVHLLIAGLSTYALARTVGMGPTASLVGGVIFACGPFLEWNTYTSLQFGQFATWIPLALLGIELSLRADHWRRRLAPWCVTSVALSQMLAGWVGEGWIYAILIIGSYVGYRAIVSPPRSGWNFGARLRRAVATGIIVLGGAGTLAAAAILPRLATNAETNLAGGDYAELGRAGIINPPWDVDYLLIQVLGMGNGYHFRAAGFGGAVAVLMLLALLLAPRRFAVPYFAGLTTVSFVLTLDTTPLHQLFYLIPGYQSLHEHDPWRAIAIASVGPAMLGGAAVEAISRLRGRYRILPVVVMPLVVVGAIMTTVGLPEGVAGRAPLVAAAAVTAIALLMVSLPPDQALPGPGRWFPRTLMALAVVVVFMQPTGLELTGSWLGWPDDPRWASRWDADPAAEQALEVETRQTDPGGAGDYLRDQLARAGPFRYLGYGGVGHPDGGWTSRSYMDRRFDPYAQAILVNGRPMFLGLYEIQGYDPIQLARYVDFIAAINGKGQDYHTAFVSDEGANSPLLDLLNVRYVLVDASLPSDRADVRALAAGRREVFRTDRMVAYETQPEPRHAWIVHDVQRVEYGEALPLLAAGTVDPYQTALVEGEVPDVEPLADQSVDRAEVTEYKPGLVAIETYTAAPGFLVVSEIYAEGWRATVNGAPADILPTHHALRGVPIPAGTSVVELRYEPLSLRLGIAISSAAALVLLVVLGSRLWHHARARRMTRPVTIDPPA